MTELLSETAPVPKTGRDASDEKILDGLGSAKELRVQLDSDAPTGGATSPTLDVKIQDSVDGGQTWNDLVTFTQVTGSAAREVLDHSTPFGRKLKIVWTIAASIGTPNYKFGVSVTAKR